VNRRQFLQAVGAAAASTMLPASIPPANAVPEVVFSPGGPLIWVKAPGGEVLDSEVWVRTQLRYIAAGMDIPYRTLLANSELVK
jgi:hypothetical protein